MYRTLEKITKGVPAADGDGIELTRFIGSSDLNVIDPLLLLDQFQIKNGDDDGSGFPPHPHRGFETVTYMLDGKMHHKDNRGNEGIIKAGEVQWMRAASGIIHSEMPKTIDGQLKGFQLWINLPAINKQETPSYQQFDVKDIPIDVTETGSEIRIIAGITDSGIQGALRNDLTEPLFLDVTIPKGQRFEQSIPESHNAIVMMIGGQAEISGSKINQDELGIFGVGSKVNISSKDDNTRFLLIAGKRLNEPIARGGPFVMNTKEEIQQAFSDYKAGRFETSSSSNH